MTQASTFVPNSTSQTRIKSGRKAMSQPTGSQDRWKDRWTFVPRYRRWIEAQGVPIYHTYFVDDLRTIEVGAWEERECNAAVVVLTGQEYQMETRVTEIPPGQALPPVKFSLDDLIYVLSGRGLATIWTEGGPKKTFEWQPHSLFVIPRNYSYQLANAQGHLPARVLHYNYLPMAMSIIPEPRFFFDNPALQPDTDILGGEEHDVYSEAKFIQGVAREGRTTGGSWVASFFPDLMAWDKLSSMGSRGPGAYSSGLAFPNFTTLRAGLPIMAAGTYKKAHAHGSGVAIVIPGGEGMSIMWPMGGEKQVYPWHEASMFAPPTLWFHQHFNLNANFAHYLTLHPARNIEPSGRSMVAGGTQIEFVDEDPWIHQTFEAELAKRGLRSLMNPEIYTNPKFKWLLPEIQELEDQEHTPSE